MLEAPISLKVWVVSNVSASLLNAFETGSGARSGIGSWIYYYNRRRPHSTFDGRTRAEVYAMAEMTAVGGVETTSIHLSQAAKLSHQVGSPHNRRGVMCHALTEWKMPEWTPYKITLPVGDAREDGVATLEKVHHVVHVPAARRILEDDRIRAGLVYDESRLNKSRRSVIWLSANTWAPGSIYGNVQFSFDWASLVVGRHFYWVEAMDKYSPNAYRILMSDHELSGSKHVTPYDPKTDDGPLRECGGEWFWNYKYTSEFMIDRDLALDECLSFEFITHNPNYCRLNGSSCSDKNAPQYKTAGRILAFLIGNDLHCLDHILKQPSIFQKTRMLANEVDSGVAGICTALAIKKSHFSGSLHKSTSRQAVIRGALALYGSDQKQAALDLLSLLRSLDVFYKALTEIVNEHFGVEGWELES